MRDILECYKILELEPGAAAERVKRSYLELMSVWDPDKHLTNPVLRAQAEKKRVEIEEAYKAIRHFLPELQEGYDKKPSASKQDRDFNELSTRPPLEASKTIIGVIMGGALLLVFAFAYHIYKQTRVLPSAPAPLMDPEPAVLAAPSTSTSTVP